MWYWKFESSNQQTFVGWSSEEGEESHDSTCRCFKLELVLECFVILNALSINLFVYPDFRLLSLMAKKLVKFLKLQKYVFWLIHVSLLSIALIRFNLILLCFNWICRKKMFWSFIDAQGRFGVANKMFSWWPSSNSGWFEYFIRGIKTKFRLENFWEAVQQLFYGHLYGFNCLEQ